MNTQPILARLLAGAAMLAAAPLYAQEVAEAEVGEATADIVVTGSRVIRNGDSSPSPVTVVTTNELLAIQPGANLADALNTLPVFAGSRGAGSNPTTGGSASGGNGSANVLNLRNLGTPRTLVLLDGRRIPPTLFNGAVDVDLIPQMLVSRVDIVTGGVSAVYGSDAVAGVVNYILDTRFTGLRAEVSGGISRYGDAGLLDAGVAWGAKLGDRGHVIASYQYHQGNGVLRRSERPWMDLVGVGGLGTTAAPYTLFTGLRQAAFPAGGRVTCGATCSINGQYFAQPGVLAPFVNGAPTGTNGLQVGGAGGTWDSSLVQPIVGHQAFARFQYELTDTLRAHVQASGNFKVNENHQEYMRLTNVRLQSNNAFLPASYQAALAAANQSTFTLSKTLEDQPRINQYAESRQYVLNAGLEGSIGEQWRWQLDYVYGKTVLDTEVRNNINAQKLNAALDAVVVGGRVVCHASIANPTAYGDCVPLNPFGQGSESPQAMDYVRGTTSYQATNDMHDVSASIAGPLAELWAGPLNVAISGEWRKVGFSSDSSATSQQLVDCTGLRTGCNPSTIRWFITLPEQDRVSQTVWELAGEFDLPIFRDWALGKAFNLNGAVRYTSYNTSGNYWTWKVGLDWQISDSLRLRGTRSRDIRAPTLYDLFAERFVVSVVSTDLLTNTSPTIPSINGGNPNLTAEIGNTLTGGIVWKPAPRLSLAVDGYRIEVTDAILAVNGGESGFQRACYESAGASPYCLLQERPGSFTDTSPSNAWTAVYNGLFNISAIKTWGIDVEANYSGELGGRPLIVRVLGTYQPELSFSQPAIPSRDQAGAAFGPVGFSATPVWRIVGFLRVQPSDHLTLDLQQRWRSSMKLSGEDGQIWTNNHMASFTTTSITLTFDPDPATRRMQFFVNVQNLFDNDPPIGGFYGNGTRAGMRDGYAVGDDARGRFFTAGARVRF